MFSDLDPTDVGRKTQLLCPATEHDKITRYATEQLRHNAAVTRLFTRSCLARYTQQPPDLVTFAVGEHGKPILAETPDGTEQVHFSVSHTSTCVCLAVTTSGPVGVDCENTPVQPGIASDLLAHLPSAEQQWLTETHPANRDSHAQRLWTLKEAYLKCTGTGLLAPLTSFSISFDHTSEHVRAIAGADHTPWALGSCSGPPSTVTSIACQTTTQIHALPVYAPEIVPGATAELPATPTGQPQRPALQRHPPASWASWWDSYQNQPMRVTADLPIVGRSAESFT